ncbi:MAG: ABC transporter ATP-binding protein [Candidatus Moraniibacteriota bacterium]
MISCKDITKVFDTGETKTHALRGVSCDINAGEFVAIMGPSGSGKSTLMHVLSFLEQKTSGEYFFRGKDTHEFDEEKLAYIRNQEIGFIFQSFNLMQRVSVFENVELPLLYDFYGRSKRKEERKKTNKERVMNALKSVSMEHRVSHMPSQLSGGEKQRIAIARALINNPTIIFADEPTGNLDSKSGLQVMHILEDLNKQGHTIILVTHESRTAEHARRILQIVDGKIVDDMTVKNQRSAKTENILK